MKGIHPDLCTHHMYIQSDCHPVRQPQRRMNPALKDIVKEELQKLLNVNFIYKNLASAELNYTVTEKEFLAVVKAINKCRHYITGYPLFIYTDHSAIRYLMNKPITHGRVTRWLLLLQEFNVTIIDKPGKSNVVADFLSRLTHDGDDLQTHSR